MLLPKIGTILPRMVAGAQRVAQARRWSLYPVVYDRDAQGVEHLARSPGGSTLQELLALLRPDGAIIALDVVGKTTLRTAARAAGLGRLLAVRLGEPEDPRNAVYAHGDAASFAELAMRELLRSGFGDFAYAPWVFDTPWSRARGAAFARFVALAGKRFHAFPGNKVSARNEAERFDAWLATLPKPCGIFAANDTAGETVLRACERLKIEVPGQVAVVSVDDETYVCEWTRPTLSSVRRDVEGEGRAAAELLAEWLAHPSRPPRPRAVPAVALVRRWSTRFSSQRDWRVAKAQEWIRLHACEGIRPNDVAREMKVSRATADRLFRNAADHTILEEIHAARIARAQERLREGVSPDLVAVECGYESTLDFRRVFRRIVGKPVVAWTKSI